MTFDEWKIRELKQKILEHVGSFKGTTQWVETEVAEMLCRLAWDAGQSAVSRTHDTVGTRTDRPREIRTGNTVIMVDHVVSYRRVQIPNGERVIVEFSTGKSQQINEMSFEEFCRRMKGDLGEKGA